MGSNMIFFPSKKTSENPLRAKSDCFSSFHCIKLAGETAKCKLSMKTFHLVIRKKALIDEGETAQLISGLCTSQVFYVWVQKKFSEGQSKR